LHKEPGNGSALSIVSPPKTLERSVSSICDDHFGMSVTTVSKDILPVLDILLVDVHTLPSTTTYDLKTLFPTYAANVPVVVELGNSKGAAHKNGLSRSMQTVLVTRKSLGSALVSSLEDANAKRKAASVLSTAFESKPEEDSAEQLAQHDTTVKIDLHVEAVVLPHRGPALQNTSPSNTAIIPTPQPQSLTQPSTFPARNSKCRFQRLLLVDDNPINLKMLCAFAKRLNVPYTSATDGAEAVRLYQTATEREGPHMSYDCIFMDISMPVMDGFQAVAKIRRIEDELMEKGLQAQTNDAVRHGLNGTHGDNRGIRAYILALTGLGSEKARKQARNSGFDEFLLKPVRFKDVLPLLAPLPTP
jgi:CheY-like chemotaxis protein